MTELQFARGGFYQLATPDGQSTILVKRYRVDNLIFGNFIRPAFRLKTTTTTETPRGNKRILPLRSYMYFCHAARKKSERNNRNDCWTEQLKRASTRLK